MPHVRSSEREFAPISYAVAANVSSLHLPPGIMIELTLDATCLWQRTLAARLPDAGDIKRP